MQVCEFTFKILGSIAFHVRIDEYTSIPIGSAVIFGFEILNIGDG